MAFIYVYGRYTGLGCHPNVQGRSLGSILESGYVFLIESSKHIHIGIQLREQSQLREYNFLEVITKHLKVLTIPYFVPVNLTSSL